MLYAIGDIHGELWKLKRLLDEIGQQSTLGDTLIFLGDYVDRGPDSCGVIELLIRLKSQRPQTVFLRGNHEEMMLNCRTLFENGSALDDFDSAASWFAAGGAETLKSYPQHGHRWFDRIPNEHWDFIQNTQMEFRQGPYLFVHAGLPPPGTEWDYDEARLWIREPFLSSSHDFGFTVIHGHTPSQDGRPVIRANRVCIDTAAVFGGPLTAVELDPHQSYDPTSLVFLSSR